ncbi:MAG TPA: peptide-methionine (S)-S-oxide reductase MsrA [Gammaproteobacteria bacterium]|nr:peptide-methionine (S)-S-oxide reductase MsrA [Gammaproteobacteria bacterium]
MFCEIRGAGLKVSPKQFPDPALDIPAAEAGHEARAVLAAGCFWCVEAVFQELDGVQAVVSGYAGGTASTADYRTVCGGATNHAEVVEIRYDPARISYGQLLKVFFSVAHDPTQLNRQGNDRGRQYRSAIFYANERERRVAAAYIKQLNEAGVFSGPIVTSLEPLEKFFEAEEYHQDYADRNPGQPYIAAVAMPKVEKLRRYFGDQLKNQTAGK